MHDYTILYFCYTETNSRRLQNIINGSLQAADDFNIFREMWTIDLISIIYLQASEKNGLRIF